MINPPKTLEEAQAIKYGAWAGRPDGTPYKPERCAYQVVPNDRAGIAGAHQCDRKNGYGPDNLYCKQHAEKMGYGEVKQYIFIAELSYGKPQLAKCAVLSETDKTYRISNANIEHILGRSYLSNRIRKGKGVFTNGKDALSFLIEETEEYIQSLENKLENAKLTFEMLIQVRDA